ncbi:flagellar motor protein MotB, partial [Enterococcus faecium]
MSRRKKKEEEHDNSERWLLSYADFITLLMIFFVVMYAMSRMDQGKSTELKQSISA